MNNMEPANTQVTRRSHKLIPHLLAFRGQIDIPHDFTNSSELVGLVEYKQAMMEPVLPEGVGTVGR